MPSVEKLDITRNIYKKAKKSLFKIGKKRILIIEFIILAMLIGIQIGYIRYTDNFMSLKENNTFDEITTLYFPHNYPDNHRNTNVEYGNDVLARLITDTYADLGIQFSFNGGSGFNYPENVPIIFSYSYVIPFSDIIAMDNSNTARDASAYFLEHEDGVILLTSFEFINYIRDYTPFKQIFMNGIPTENISTESNPVLIKISPSQTSNEEGLSKIFDKASINITRSLGYYCESVSNCTDEIKTFNWEGVEVLQLYTDGKQEIESQLKSIIDRILLLSGASSPYNFSNLYLYLLPSYMIWNQSEDFITNNNPALLFTNIPENDYSYFNIPLYTNSIKALHKACSEIGALQYSDFYRFTRFLSDYRKGLFGFLLKLTIVALPIFISSVYIAASLLFPDYRRIKKNLENLYLKGGSWLIEKYFRGFNRGLYGLLFIATIVLLEFETFMLQFIFFEQKDNLYLNLRILTFNSDLGPYFVLFLLTWLIILNKLLNWMYSRSESETIHNPRHRSHKGKDRLKHNPKNITRLHYNHATEKGPKIKKYLKKRYFRISIEIALFTFFAFKIYHNKPSTFINAILAIFGISLVFIEFSILAVEPIKRKIIKKYIIKITQSNFIFNSLLKIKKSLRKNLITYLIIPILVINSFNISYHRDNVKLADEFNDFKDGDIKFTIQGDLSEFTDRLYLIQKEFDKINVYIDDFYSFSVYEIPLSGEKRLFRVASLNFSKYNTLSRAEILQTNGITINKLSENSVYLNKDSQIPIPNNKITLKITPNYNLTIDNKDIIHVSKISGIIGDKYLFPEVNFPDLILNENKIYLPNYLKPENTTITLFLDFNDNTSEIASEIYDNISVIIANCYKSALLDIEIKPMGKGYFLDHFEFLTYEFSLQMFITLQSLLSAIYIPNIYFRDANITLEKAPAKISGELIRDILKKTLLLDMILTIFLLSISYIAFFYAFIEMIYIF